MRQRFLNLLGTYLGMSMVFYLVINHFHPGVLSIWKFATLMIEGFCKGVGALVVILAITYIIKNPHRKVH